jgi:hypothetical protein
MVAAVLNAFDRETISEHPRSAAILEFLHDL